MVHNQGRSKSGFTTAVPGQVAHSVYTVTQQGRTDPEINRKVSRQKKGIDLSVNVVTFTEDFTKSCPYSLALEQMKDVIGASVAERAWTVFALPTSTGSRPAVMSE
jgi:hypothetical protein